MLQFSFVGYQWFIVAALLVGCFMVAHKFQWQALLYLLAVIYATPATITDFFFLSFLVLITVLYSGFRNAAS